MWRRRYQKLFPSMLGVLLGLCAVAWIAVRNYRSVQDEFRREPTSPLLTHPEKIGIRELQSLWLKTELGVNVAAWYVPTRNGAAVILCHGGNADRAQMLPEIHILTEAGYGVLSFDWPGQGQSGGSADWGPLDTAALRTAFVWLTKRQEIDPDKIGGLGFSMGGYLLSQFAAAEPRLRAVILEAAPSNFLEYETIAHRKWGPLSEFPARLALHKSAMPYWHDQPVEVVGKIAPRPVLVIGGEHDLVVPPTLVHTLFNASGQPKELWLVPNAGHGGYATAAPLEYRRRIVTFFDHGLGITRRS